MFRDQSHPIGLPPSRGRFFGSLLRWSPRPLAQSWMDRRPGLFRSSSILTICLTISSRNSSEKNRQSRIWVNTLCIVSRIWMFFSWRVLLPSMQFLCFLLWWLIRAPNSLWMAVQAGLSCASFFFRRRKYKIISEGFLKRRNPGVVSNERICSFPPMIFTMSLHKLGRTLVALLVSLLAALMTLL